MSDNEIQIEEFVLEQITKWKERGDTRPAVDGRCSVITLSMEPGSGGRVIGQRVADRLGFDFFHRDIIKGIAKNAHISEQVIDSVEKERLSGVEDFLSSILRKKYFHPGSYQHHLVKVVHSIGRHGRAVIVGRGANFILAPDAQFSVRVVAPLEQRIRNVAREFQSSLDEAEKRIMSREKRRKEFVRQAFRKNIEDPHHYDMVLNTGRLHLEAAISALLSAFTIESQRRHCH